MAREVDRLHITKNKYKVMSIIDAEMMYPSITFQIVRIAILYFPKKADREVTGAEIVKVEKCLEFIKFGMGHLPLHVHIDVITIFQMKV